MSQDVATGVAFHFSSDGALRDGRPLPCLRYAVQSAKNSALYKHPNNIVHRELANHKRAVLNRYDSASDAEDEHELVAPDAIGGAGGDAAGVAAGDASPDAGAGAGGDVADCGSYYMDHGDNTLRSTSGAARWATSLRAKCVSRIAKRAST